MAMCWDSRFCKWVSVLLDMRMVKLEVGVAEAAHLHAPHLIYLKQQKFIDLRMLGEGLELFAG